MSDLLTEQELEQLVLDAASVNDRIERGIKSGQLMTLPAAGRHFDLTRQNFTKAIKDKTLRVIRQGRVLLTTLDWVRTQRQGLAFTRKDDPGNVDDSHTG